MKKGMKEGKNGGESSEDEGRKQGMNNQGQNDRMEGMKE